MTRLGPDPNDALLSRLIVAFDAHLCGERRASKYTRRNYGATLDRFDEFLRSHHGRPADLKLLETLETNDFRAFLACRQADGLSPQSLKLELSALKAFYRYIEDRAGVSNDAITLMRGPRAKDRLPRPVSADDAGRLIEEVDGGDEIPWIQARDRAVLTLLYGAGLRISEALSLKGQDAPLQASLRIVGKGGRMRQVPVLAVVRERVETYRTLCPHPIEANGPLFLSMRGKALSARLVQRTLKIATRTLGLPETATPHALRHAFATELLARGGDLRAVQELLGHASIAATQRYTLIDEAALMNVYAASHPRAD